MKITKNTLNKLIREELAKITEARQLPGLGDAPGPAEPDYDGPVDVGPEPISDPALAAEIIYDDIVFDGAKNWVANNGRHLDFDEVIEALGRYIIENPAE